jgi:hypothetical protein
MRGERDSPQCKRDMEARDRPGRHTDFTQRQTAARRFLATSGLISAATDRAITADVRV